MWRWGVSCGYRRGGRRRGKSKESKIKAAFVKTKFILEKPGCLMTMGPPIQMWRHEVCVLVSQGGEASDGGDYV